MFKINNITRGRFGNRILHYNNLMQLSYHWGQEASCSPWEGHTYFSNLVTERPPENPQIILKYDQISSPTLTSTFDYAVEQNCLHNVFWDLTKYDPRLFMQIQDKFTVTLDNTKTNIGIHLRGGDFLTRSPRQVHYPDFYLNAIDLVESQFENIKYYVCTDDYSFGSFIATINYLRSKNCEFEIGGKDHFFDFALLSECDILIASSSTFVICAGFLGKPDKKIIHSLEWVMKNLPGDTYDKWGTYTEEYPESFYKSFDNFWIKLYNGGNEYYHAWKFI